MNPEKVYYFDTYIAGRLYADADSAWQYLRVGQKLSLSREPENIHDSSAIALYSAHEGNSYKLGYIPLRKNQPIALLIDMGWGEAFEATISRLDPAATYDRQIGITVKIVKNNNRESDKPQKS